MIATRPRPAAQSAPPLVSVIIPVYQGEAFVEGAVRSALAQTHRALEVFVVDDGSTDATLARLARIDDDRLRVLRQPNAGTAAARNNALAHARGAYIAFLDCDDRWFPDKIATELAVLQRAGEPAIAYGAHYAVDDRGALLHAAPLRRHSGPAFDLMIDGEDFLMPSLCLFDRRIFDAIGTFDESRYHEDHDLILRATRRFPIYPTLRRQTVYRQTTGGKARKILARLRCRARRRDGAAARVRPDPRAPRGRAAARKRRPIALSSLPDVRLRRARAPAASRGRVRRGSRAGMKGRLGRLFAADRHQPDRAGSPRRPVRAPRRAPSVVERHARARRRRVALWLRRCWLRDPAPPRCDASASRFPPIGGRCCSIACSPGSRRCTFRRTPAVEVVVVDNDPLESARALVAARTTAFRFPLAYEPVAEPGLSSVRNFALTYANGRCALLAMIDDDEAPQPQWLAELLRVQEATGADAVVGPVPHLLPSEAPRWLRDGPFFDLPVYADQEAMTDGYSGNCLLSVDAVARLGLRFDPALNFAGGEDLLFFRQLLRGGARLVYAANAVAEEAVGTERVTLSYLLRLNFRRGNTLALCDLRLPTWRLARTARAREGVRARRARPADRSLHGPLSRGKTGAVIGLCDVAHGFGGLTGLFGHTYQAYGRTIDGTPLSTADDCRNAAHGGSEWWMGLRALWSQCR